MRLPYSRKLLRENLRGLLAFSVPKDTTPNNFVEKTFTNSHKTTKFANVFILESFLLYGIPFFSQTFAMSGEDWGDSVPVDAPTVEVKLFGKWSPDEVHVNDISLAVSSLPVSACLLRSSYRFVYTQMFSHKSFTVISGSPIEKPNVTLLLIFSTLPVCCSA